MKVMPKRKGGTLRKEGDDKDEGGEDPADAEEDEAEAGADDEQALKDDANNAAEIETGDASTGEVAQDKTSDVSAVAAS
jgi:hypothetical protein